MAPQRPTRTRSVLHGTLLIGGVGCIAKAAGLLREMLTARHFGVSENLDAFAIALLPVVYAISITTTVAEGLVVPGYHRVREADGAGAARSWENRVFLLSLAAICILAMLLYAVGTRLLPYLGWGLSPTALALADSLLHVLLPFLVFGASARILTAMLSARQAFGTVALGPLFPPLAIVIGLSFCSPDADVSLLAFCLIAGGLAQVAFMAVRLIRIRGERPSAWKPVGPAISWAAVLPILPMLAASMLASSTMLVDLSMATLLGPGSASTFHYGSKITTLLIALGTAALARVLLPRFSQQAARADWVALEQSLKRYARVVLLIAVAVAILGALAAQPSIRLLLEGGRFSSAHTHAVAEVHACYLLQLPFYSLSILLSRVLYALTHIRIVLLAAFTNVVLNVCFNFLLMKHFGLAGIALSTVGVHSVSSAWMLVWVRRHLARSIAARPERADSAARA